MLLIRVIAWTAAIMTIATMTVDAQPSPHPPQSSLGLDEAGEYLVEVVRRAPYCEPPVVSHLLSLTLTAQSLR